MENLTQNGPADFIETVLTSFEERIQKIEAAFSTSEAVYNSSNVLMKDFQQSLTELRNERTQLNTMLRENLAKKGSMRKNDYDCFMDDIFQLLNEKEKEAEDQFCCYIDDQKQMVLFLRQGIFEIKSTEQDDHKEKIAAFKARLDNTLKEQQHRKECAIAKFMEFQHLHKKITSKFQQLLDQDHIVFGQDIKNIKKQLLGELV